MNTISSMPAMNTLGLAKCDGSSQDQLNVPWPFGACPAAYFTSATIENRIKMTNSSTSRATWMRADTWMPR